MMIYCGIAMVVVITGCVIAMLMVLRDKLVSDRKEKLIDQITSNIINGYLPAAMDVTIEGVEKMFDSFTKKIPKIMKEMSKV